MAEKRKETGIVMEQTCIGTDIYSMWIETKEIAENAKAGQFISLYCREGGRLLPRPISICEIDREKKALRVVYRIAGEGTREFSGLKEGDSIEILGPLGNGFGETDKKKAFLIGGGIGIPPMLELAKQLKCEKDIILGYRDAQMFLKDEFEGLGNIYIATEDGSVGTKGNVLNAIRELGLEADILYACGPTPMLKALQAYAKEAGMEAYLSLEERMACGVGACLACVCKSKDVDHHTNNHNKRVCADGPVFNAEEVEF